MQFIDQFKKHLLAIEYVSNPVYFSTPVFMFQGHRVFLDDLYILGVSGVHETIPGATVHKGKDYIVINQALFDTVEYRDAILAHELAHLKLNHTFSNLSNIQVLLSIGEGFKQEVEADRYSYEQGYNMLEALEYLATKCKSYNLNRRINLLKELTK